MSPGIAFRTETMDRSPAATDPMNPAQTGPSGLDSKRSLPWRVIKLGGTSVADPSALDHTVRAVRDARRECSVVLVVSARGTLTDRLNTLVDGVAAGEVDAADELAEIGLEHRDYLARVTPSLESQTLENRSSEARSVEKPAPSAVRACERMVDDLQAASSLCSRIRRQAQVPLTIRAQVLATGERLAASILSARLAHSGIVAERVDATELIVATGAMLDADPDLQATRSRVDSRLGSPGFRSSEMACSEPGRVVVVPGFFATGSDGRLLLLGRGGSDTSAATLGAALGADRVEIWTDVDGVYPSDPRLDSTLRPFARLTYQQAEQMAMAGARVLHAKAIAPVRRTGTPLTVRNAFRPETPGTWIRAEVPAACAERELAGAGQHVGSVLEVRAS